MLNEILIRRKSCVVLEPEGNELPVALVGTILKNLEGYGYTLAPDVIDIVRTLSCDSATKFHSEVIGIVRKLKGADKKMKPMYPNFPKQVMEASDAELYLNAVMHYLGRVFGMRILPEYEEEPREPLFEATKAVVLRLGSEDDIHRMCSNLMASRTSISETDKADLTWYVEEYRGNLVLPAEMPNKEVLAFMAGLLPLEHLAPYFKTATDLLRVAVAMSGGDVSLAKKTKFRSFKQKERRFFLGRLNDLKQPISDMARHRAMWIRLGERLHPGDQKKRYPSAWDAFQRMRDGKTIETPRSLVERAMLDLDVPAALDVLRKSPGELARRLDHLLRSTDDPEPVIQVFGEGIDKVATPVVLQVMAHFSNRPGAEDIRAVFPKGRVAKMKVLPANKLPLASGVEPMMANMCRQELVRRFGELEPMGKVYMDPSLVHYTVPFSQRSASKALRTLSRGSRLLLDPEKGTVRFFTWWRDVQGETSSWTRTVDVDLSVVFYDQSWGYRGHVSWTALRDMGCYHSGDITSAPNGACEFIDLDLDHLAKNGTRYALPALLSYSGQKFSEFECFCGWMTRGQPQSGEIFEPKTVEQRIDLSAETKLIVPAIIDVVERQVTWADISLRNKSSLHNTVEANGNSLALMGQAMMSLRKPNLGELLMCHVEGRGGELVDSSEEADVVFSPTEGITPYDIDEIVANWLV
jgi:hypothetical protein